MKWTNDDYIITDNREALDVECIHRFLQDSYWAEGIPREVVEQSIEHSLCFGLFRDLRQIGFARAVTDRATFAYLADVFVIHDYQGRGLVSCIREHPDLQNLRRWILATADAHGLYEQYGFLSWPSRTSIWKSTSATIINPRDSKCNWRKRTLFLTAKRI